MIGKLDATLQFHQAALAVRAERQQIISSNIANADTPHYKARDLDFSQAMRGALNGAATLKAAPLYRAERQGSIDGNTVDMDVERNQFAENALRYEAGLTLISAQIKGLLTAIQGQ